MEISSGFESFLRAACWLELSLRLCNCGFASCLLQAVFPSLPALFTPHYVTALYQVQCFGPEVRLLGLQHCHSCLLWFFIIFCPPTLVSLLVWDFVLNIFLVKSCCSFLCFKVMKQSLDGVAFSAHIMYKTQQALFFVFTTDVSLGALSFGFGWLSHTACWEIWLGLSIPFWLISHPSSVAPTEAPWRSPWSIEPLHSQTWSCLDHVSYVVFGLSGYVPSPCIPNCACISLL